MAKRPEQSEIEINGVGVAPIKIPAIEKAARAYVTVRDDRMALTEKEVAAKSKLVEVIHANQEQLGKNPKGEVIYRFDDLQVILKGGKENVKVRSVDSPTEDED